VINIRNASSLNQAERARGLREQTYQDGRVIGDVGRRLSFGFLVCVDNLDVLDVAPSEDDVFELLLRGRDEVAHFALFGAVREDILQSNR
jgi:hypothetical protein